MNFFESLKKLQSSLAQIQRQPFPTSIFEQAESLQKKVQLDRIRRIQNEFEVISKTIPSSKGDEGKALATRAKELSLQVTQLDKEMEECETLINELLKQADEQQSAVQQNVVLPNTLQQSAVQQNVVLPNALQQSAVQNAVTANRAGIEKMKLWSVDIAAARMLVQETQKLSASVTQTLQKKAVSEFLQNAEQIVKDFEEEKIVLFANIEEVHTRNNKVWEKLTQGLPEDVSAEEIRRHFQSSDLTPLLTCQDETKTAVTSLLYSLAKRSEMALAEFALLDQSEAVRFLNAEEESHYARLRKVLDFETVYENLSETVESKADPVIKNYPAEMQNVLRQHFNAYTPGMNSEEFSKNLMTKAKSLKSHIETPMEYLKEAFRQRDRLKTTTDLQEAKLALATILELDKKAKIEVEAFKSKQLDMVYVCFFDPSLVLPEDQKELELIQGMMGRVHEEGSNFFKIVPEAFINCLKESRSSLERFERIQTVLSNLPAKEQIQASCSKVALEMDECVENVVEKRKDLNTALENEKSQEQLTTIIRLYRELQQLVRKAKTTEKEFQTHAKNAELLSDARQADKNFLDSIKALSEKVSRALNKAEAETDEGLLAEIQDLSTGL